MAKYNMVVKSHGVVSNRIFNEINDSMFEAFREFEIKWALEDHREAMTKSTALFLNEYVDGDEIINFKVVCDERNNVFTSATTTFYFDIIYRQKHCVDKTELNYIITQK